MSDRHLGLGIIAKNFSMGKAWILGFLAMLGAGSAYLEPELMESSMSNSTEVLLGKRSAYSGMATWYDVETWKAGACGQDIDNSMHIVALNEPMYGSLNERSSWCGKKIMIANGLKTAKAVIMDACPQTKQCHHGALDMSMSLFQEFHHLVLGVFPITWWTIDDDDDDDHPSHPPEKTSSHSHHDNSTSSRSDSSSSHSSTPSSSSSSSSFASSSSSSPTSSSKSDGNAASRSSERSAASASAASARARAASIAKKQSLSKASARSASSASQEMAASSHASSHGSQTHATTSSPSSSSSSGGRTPHQDTTTSTNTSNDDDPRAGNLENFVKVLNGLSMLVHAAAHDEQE